MSDTATIPPTDPTDPPRADLESVAPRFHDAGHGYDEFGMSRAGVLRAYQIGKPLYDYWFRVQSSGAEQLARMDGVVIAANHSGTLPFDGVMLWHDIVRRTHRVPRPLADYFVPSLPLVSSLYARAGVVVGARKNAQRLLERGEMIMVFPEGTEGVGKPFYERYTLARWSVGHAELAIRHRVPVVPVGIIGGEEQMPLLAKIGGLQLFGAPYLPIPLTPIPLPVRFHLHYGEPVVLSDNYRQSDADDPEAVKEAAEMVKDAVDKLIQRGLTQRKGIFS